MRVKYIARAIQMVTSLKTMRTNQEHYTAIRISIIYRAAIYLTACYGIHFCPYRAELQLAYNK